MEPRPPKKARFWALLARWDDRLANVESALAVAILLSMVLVAFSQALLRNLATRLDWAAAHQALETFASADVFLQKATLWVALLGASLATRVDKHIAIDLIPRLAGTRLSALIKAVTQLVGSLVSGGLALVFWAAVLNYASMRPFDYEVLTGGQGVHLCEASASALAQTGASRPGIFCALRSLFGQLGVTLETPESTALLVVPFALIVICLRMLGKGLVALRTLKGEPPTGGATTSQGGWSTPNEVDRSSETNADSSSQPQGSSQDGSPPSTSGAA